ncbi:MAG: glutamate-5-semialdehyde dehydrogenase [bacterium]|nr:glutamate-5-semialdehyde dehydrogenase [bacterium]
MELLEIAKNAKLASIKLANMKSEDKNSALNSIAEALENNKENIINANKEDLKYAEVMVEQGKLSRAVYNRLKLDDNKFRSMVDGVRDLIKLDDPINKCLLARQMDKNLTLYKISCPIGVLGIIFEARPDVITQVVSLAIKSSNAVILKGGKEAKNTNVAIFDAILCALEKIDDFPKYAISQVFSHDDVAKMLNMNDFIDLIIPRGSNSLVKFIKENTSIPVLGHADGICHIFVDEKVSLDLITPLIIDSKTQYPSACNSVETLLIHKNFEYKEQLYENLRNADIKLVFEPEKWNFEYGDKILAVKIVENLEEAISHINIFGSGHTDAIYTDNISNAELFMNEVNSAGVYHNVSTRFADGYRYGFGAEVGISTSKTHARGPVGLEGLTIYKYKLFGNGQIVKDYVDGTKKFNHKDL